MALNKNSKMKIEPNISELQNSISGCKSQFNDLDDQPCDVLCLLCDASYTLSTNEQDFLAHLFQEHRLVLGDVNKIASLKSYVRYWRMRFKEQPLTAFCTTLVMNSNSSTESANSKASPGEFYFLLSDCLAEDKALKDELCQAKLEWVLAEQVKERADTTFKRGCIFCRTEFSGSRIEYIKHLYQKHNILLGKPEHLVFIDDFLDKIQNSIESFICIYCEKKFKNRIVLKEHMRKKLHKQVNPNNKTYDKYYVTNYIPDRSSNEKRKSVKVGTIELEDPAFSSEDEDWSDWNNEGIIITCLFCKYSTQDFSMILHHMEMEHGFNFENITKDLTFYQKVKIVNYIRRQIHTGKCVYCDASVENLIAHMDEENHYKLPSKQIWDQPGFYFPMFDGDSFLYSLDTNSDDEEINT